MAASHLIGPWLAKQLRSSGGALYLTILVKFDRQPKLPPRLGRAALAAHWLENPPERPDRNAFDVVGQVCVQGGGSRPAARAE